MTFATGRFELNRDFAVPADRLWTLLTSHVERQAWAAPSDDMILETDLADLREDGFEIQRCGPKDAPDFTVETRWYRLNAPHAACFTETLVFGGARATTALVTYQLSQSGGMTALQAQVAITSFDGEEALGEVEAGWASALDRLEARLIPA